MLPHRILVLSIARRLLLDTSWPGFDGYLQNLRAAIAASGCSEISVIVGSHHHSDHIGSVPAVLAHIPEAKRARLVKYLPPPHSPAAEASASASVSTLLALCTALYWHNCILT